MDFGIEIRNVDTGRAETLHGKQAVADFLAAHPGETWEGYKCLGELPAPTPAVDPILPPLSEAMTALEASVGDSVVGEVEMSAENPLGLQSVADAQAAGVVSHPLVPNPLTGSTLVLGEGARVNQNLELSVVDAGKGDTYLPVDQGAQS